MAPKEPHSNTDIRSESAISSTHSKVDTVQFPVGIVAALHCRRTGDVPLEVGAHGATRFTAD
jgi:hypothetical protein